MAAYKGTVELGGLYQDGRAIPRPDQPWLIDTSVLQPYDGLMPGNIADFSGNPDWSAWVLGDTPTQELARLRWHVLEDEGRTLLICDRVILVKVSWNDLNQVGFVNGAAVQIDGRRWNCRLLTGGSQPRQGSDGHSRGAPEGNEWDHYVVNEAGIKGLPMPALSDTDQILSVVDKASAHNQFWNWMGVNTMPFGIPRAAAAAMRQQRFSTPTLLITAMKTSVGDRFWSSLRLVAASCRGRKCGRTRCEHATNRVYQ